MHNAGGAPPALNGWVAIPGMDLPSSQDVIPGDGHQKLLAAERVPCRGYGRLWGSIGKGAARRWGWGGATAVEEAGHCSSALSKTVQNERQSQERFAVLILTAVLSAGSKPAAAATWSQRQKDKLQQSWG